MEASTFKKYVRNLIISVVVVTSVILFLGFIGRVDIYTLYLLSPYIIIGFFFFFGQYIIKVIKFYLLWRDLGNDGVSFLDAFRIRIASELFSLIGLSYLGDEAFRILILNRKYGVQLHRSGLIGYLEVLSEVVTSLCIVIFGIILLLIKGISINILVPIAVSAAVVSLVNFLIVFKPDVVGGFLKNLLFKLRRILGRERVESVIRNMDSFMEAFNKDLGEALFTRGIFSVLVVLTFISTVFGGLSLWIISYGLGYEINVLYAIIILNFSVVLSTLPITISGSGVFEIVILVLGGSLVGGLPWLLPIAYRISSYYIPLVITLLFFVVGARKYLDF